MSLHKQPLTLLEAEGLHHHRLPLGVPSQLSDAFRLGVAWALSKSSPKSLEEHIIKPHKLVALLSGGDWTDASVTFLKVPSTMCLAEEKAKYDLWYQEQYCKTLRTRFCATFMSFTDWLRKAGAVDTDDSDLEILDEDA